MHWQRRWRLRVRVVVLKCLSADALIIPQETLEIHEWMRKIDFCNLVRKAKVLFWKLSRGRLPELESMEDLWYISESAYQQSTLARPIIIIYIHLTSCIIIHYFLGQSLMHAPSVSKLNNIINFLIGFSANHNKYLRVTANQRVSLRIWNKTKQMPIHILAGYITNRKE